MRVSPAGVLSIEGTDLDMTISQELPSAYGEPGSICVEAKALADVVSKSKAGSIRLSDAGGARLSAVDCATGQGTKLATLKIADWPVLAFGGKGSISAAMEFYAAELSYDWLRVLWRGAHLSAQRRTALWSVAAATALVVLKLVVGLSAHSLGLISEAAHSGTDLVAALLTFLALGVAGRPADLSHQYGHGKAEHLAALAEASFLSLASVLIAVRAIDRLIDPQPSAVHTAPYVFITIGIVIAIDASRASRLLARRAADASAALASNALHFASDLAGSVAVLVGLLLVRAGHPGGDPVAALFVAVLVLSRRRAADPRQRRRPHGPCADPGRGGSARGDRGARPTSSCAGCGCGRRAAGSSPTS